MVDERMYRCDVAVVGAGLAGLTAAVVAARAGARTVLVEPRPLGGRARTRTVGSGSVFNGGPRALYLGGVGHRTLRSLGIDAAGSTPPLQPAAVLVGSTAHQMPTGPWSLLRTGLLGAGNGGGMGSRLSVAKLLSGIQRIDTDNLCGASVDEWLSSVGLRGPAADLVNAVIRLATYVDRPDELAADAAVAQLQLALGGGVRYLDGGWQQLVDRLAAEADRAGVVHLSSTARSVGRPEAADQLGNSQHTEPGSPEQGTASGRPGTSGRWVIELDIGAQVHTGAVVLATGTPAAAAGLSPAELGPTELGLDGIGAPATAACLELAVRRSPRFQLLLGIDEPLYLARHSPPADLAGPGIEVVHIMRYGSTTAESDRAVLWAHAAAAGLDDECVVDSRFLASMTVTGGIPLASAGGLPGRPPVRVAAAEGLFLAGDWVGDQGMLGDAALWSGSVAGSQAAAIAASAPLVAAG